MALASFSEGNRMATTYFQEDSCCGTGEDSPFLFPPGFQNILSDQTFLTELKLKGQHDK